MDPFTQRMLERARARQEKIDQKLANSGQTVPKRKPLSENIAVVKSENSPVKSPSKMARESITSPRRQSKDCTKSETPTKAVAKRSSMKSDVASPQRRNDVIVTKKEFKSPKRGSINRRNSDVSVEINISHRNDIQIEVQVEERDAPICVVYDSQAQSGNTVVIKEITEDTPSIMEKAVGDAAESKSDRPALRHNIKSRLDRLGNLYSDTPTLSSPIHRTELQFSAATPPTEQQQQQQQQQQQKPRQQPGKKFGRLAALADQINNWEDDLSHHTYQPDSNKTASKSEAKQDKDASTLDVSIHSFKDINKVLDSAKSRPKETKKFDSHTFTKSSMNECQRLNRQIVAELEPKCASTTPSAASAPNMATMVAPSPANPAVTKKPSIKKYKAPTPPRNIITEDDCESEKDKENAVQLDDNGVSDDCKQTKPEPADDKPAPEKGSPLVKKLAPKINGSVDRSSVLSKAAMFETGSPKAKDPAEMSLRERKALFEKNKGAAIVPKAPFGLAPSVKTLLGENKGTSEATNPIAMSTVFKNTVFTNVGETNDGGVWWEGMGAAPESLTDWKGQPWDPSKKTPAAHPNSRFCTPAEQCPIIDSEWESSEGVPISAILLGGRRPAGVPLVVEARDWNHGVFMGATMRSEATAAAEHSGKTIMHDPFAMRPFFGYNFGDYLKHWLSMPKPGRQVPKIFHVNWFRKNDEGKFLWPGFGENSRVLDWILRRCDNEPCYTETPLGFVPKQNDLNVQNLGKIDMDTLFSIPKDFWLQEADAIEKYFKEEVGQDLPKEMWQELEKLRKNVQQS